MYQLAQYNSHGLLVKKVQEDSSKRIETVRDEENPFIIHRNIEESGVKTEEIYVVYNQFAGDVKNLIIGSRGERVDGNIEKVRKELAGKTEERLSNIKGIDNRARWGSISATWKDAQNQNINLDKQEVQL